MRRGAPSDALRCGDPVRWGGRMRCGEPTRCCDRMRCAAAVPCAGAISCAAAVPALGRTPALRRSHALVEGCGKAEVPRAAQGPMGLPGGKRGSERRRIKPTAGVGLPVGPAKGSRRMRTQLSTDIAARDALRPPSADPVARISSGIPPMRARGRRNAAGTLDERQCPHR